MKKPYPNGGRQARSNELLSLLYLPQQQGNVALGRGKQLLSRGTLSTHVLPEFILPRVV